MKKRQLKSIIVPALETTAEGKLRGGFSSIGNAGISVCGGPNDHCDRNDVCSDNDYCYDNSDSQLCAGNRTGSDCSSHRSSSTSTSDTSSTSISNGLTDIFLLL